MFARPCSSIARKAWVYCSIATFIVAVVLGTRHSAQAALIGAAADISSPTVIDFSQFAGLGYNFTFGPAQIGALVGSDVVFTADPAGGGNSASGSVLGDGDYSLLSNGGWDTGPGGNAYSGLDGDVGHMTYTFNDGPVSGVGGFINYIPDSGFGPTLVEALATDGVTVLESYALNTVAPISTSGGLNDGAFRGILRASADIGAFRVSGGYVVLDDLTFGANGAQATFGANGAQANPEPASLAIWGLGLGGVGLVKLRRRKNKQAGRPIAGRPFFA